MPESSTTLLRKYSLCIPFLYAFESRYGWPRDFLVNLVQAWVPGVILVAALTQLSLVDSVGLFLVGYLAFISIYEIGYMVNDSIGLRHDPTPRARINVRFDPLFVVTFIVVRLTVFASIAILGNVFSETTFWAAYLALVVMLTLHNLLRPIEFKFLSFLQLSVLRFSLPTFFALIHVNSSELLILVALLGVFVFVYPRFITYLDAKGRLHIPERKKTRYLLVSLIIMAPAIAVISFYSRTWAPIIVWIWLLIVQIAYVGVGSIPALSKLKTSLGMGYDGADPSSKF